MKKNPISSKKPTESINTHSIAAAIKQTIIISVVLSIFAIGATQAHAYCVYNYTSLPISEVHGEYCSRCLSSSIAKNGKACCPGDKEGCRGKTWITVSVPNTPWQTGMHYGHCGERVTAHGWVKIYGTGQFFRCEVYDDNGRLIWNDQLKDGKKY